MKKSIMCLLLLVLCGAIYSVIHTYGLYEDNLEGNVEANAASFVLKINNNSIDATNTNFVINNITVTGNNHTKSSKLAPGSMGYFDITLEPYSVNVSVRFDITLDMSDMSNSIMMRSINNTTKNELLIRTDENTYSGVISIDDINNNISNTIRLTLEWVNNDDNNSSDSRLMDAENIDIPVSIFLSQYLGETLEPYTEE